MNIRRRWLGPSLCAIGAALGCLSGCCTQVVAVASSKNMANVPDGDRRLSLTGFSAETPALATCVMRTKNAGDCNPDNGPNAPPACVAASAAEVKAKLDPVFAKLANFKLKGPSDAKASAAGAVSALQALFPQNNDQDYYVTTNVADARRAHGCSDVSEGPCVAMRHAGLWILMHAAAGGDGTVDKVDLFSVEPTPCDDEVLH